MNLEQNRDALRTKTAYRAGRIAVDILLVLWWIAALVLLVLFFLAYKVALTEAGNVLEVTLAIQNALEQSTTYQVTTTFDPVEPMPWAT